MSTVKAESRAGVPEIEASGRRIVVDLDGTLTLDAPSAPYSSQVPNIEVVARLREYRAMGFTVVILTARGMRSCGSSIGLINAGVLPGIVEWLDRHQIPYDEIHVGKPWCGDAGFYVDDRAIRPSEFIRATCGDIREMLRAERVLLGTERGNR